MHSVRSFPVFMFWITGTRLAHTVKVAYRSSRVEAVCSMQLLLPNGSDKRQRSGWIKAVGCWFESGRV